METVRSLDKIGKYSTLAITEVSLTEGGIDLTSKPRPRKAAINRRRNSVPMDNSLFTVVPKQERVE